MFFPFLTQRYLDFRPQVIRMVIVEAGKNQAFAVRMDMPVVTPYIPGADLVVISPYET